MVASTSDPRAARGGLHGDAIKVREELGQRGVPEITGHIAGGLEKAAQQ
jgi:hypothetical protein